MDALDSFDWEGMADGLEEIAREYYPELLALAGGQASQDLPVGVDFSLSNPRVAETVDRLATEIRGVSDTVKDNIRQLLAQGLQNGDSVDTIAKSIRDFGVTDSKSRAEIIARSETAKAYTQGALLAYQDAGVSEKKWLASPNSCDECMALDGEVVGLDERFSGGVDGPPLHPNCTCAAAPYLGGGSDE